MDHYYTEEGSNKDHLRVASGSASIMGVFANAEPGASQTVGLKDVSTTTTTNVTEETTRMNTWSSSCSGNLPLKSQRMYIDNMYNKLGYISLVIMLLLAMLVPARAAWQDNIRPKRFVQLGK